MSKIIREREKLSKRKRMMPSTGPIRDERPGALLRLQGEDRDPKRPRR